ncbi:MAG: TdeIII family type II restriction endonuclease [Bacteroidales bacterium]|jgi:hypothetical protein|nr:TdeIII family type II restriction endonuclease [Bacteroidales bacterium]
MNTERKISSEKAIRELVASNVRTFAQTFSERHISEFDDPDGTLNMKIHNVFIAVLGEEIQYYTALVRSFDSSLGNMLENLAVSIAKFFYSVTNHVSGPLYSEQITIIAELLEAYKNTQNPKRVSVRDYLLLKNIKNRSKIQEKTHISDYYLFDEESDQHFLIELKIGGDLDNKKARAEKEAIFEQYAILSNTLGKDAKIKCYFATAYNRYGEKTMTTKDFWNFVCKFERGYEIIMDELYKNVDYIVKAKENILYYYLERVA